MALEEMDEPGDGTAPGARAPRGPLRRAGAGRAGGPRTRGAARLAGPAPVRFVRECWAELQRVQWPDRVHLWQATAVVIIACVVVGTYLYALDSVVSRAAHWLVDKQTH